MNKKWLIRSLTIAVSLVLASACSTGSDNDMNDQSPNNNTPQQDENMRFEDQDRNSPDNDMDEEEPDVDEKDIEKNQDSDPDMNDDSGRRSG